MASTHKPHPPPPLYPMYPEERKVAKPKPKKDESRKCPCFAKRKKPRSVVELARQRLGESRLDFWSVYGVPYVLLLEGLITSILSPILALAFRNDCPALPVLYPALLGKMPFAFVEAATIFLMSAEAFRWNESYYWVSKITDKVNWRFVAGFLLALFIAWGTLIVVAISERYTKGRPVSHDPKSPMYCHQFLYQYAKMNKVIMLSFFCSAAVLFVVGGTLLLCLLCIVSRIGS